MDDLQFVPEPYRAMIRAINPEDIYLVQKIKSSGEPVRVRRIDASMPASQANDIEIHMASPTLTIDRLRGRDLRSLFLELARAHGHIIGGAVMVNPYPQG